MASVYPNAGTAIPWQITIRRVAMTLYCMSSPLLSYTRCVPAQTHCYGEPQLHLPHRQYLPKLSASFAPNWASASSATFSCPSTYMHNNPVKPRRLAQPDDWPWSSWRFYHLEDTSILAMDRIP